MHGHDETRYAEAETSREDRIPHEKHAAACPLVLTPSDETKCTDYGTPFAVARGGFFISAVAWLRTSLTVSHERRMDRNACQVDVKKERTTRDGPQAPMKKGKDSQGGPQDP